MYLIFAMLIHGGSVIPNLLAKYRSYDKVSVIFHFCEYELVENLEKKHFKCG